MKKIMMIIWVTFNVSIVKSQGNAGHQPKTLYVIESSLNELKTDHFLYYPKDIEKMDVCPMIV
jgi:hypothetical protein